MSRTLRAIWDSVVGLIVEDSQLAIGILAALMVTWLLGTAIESLRDIVGWLLLSLLIVVLLLNLALTTRRVRRRVT
jgi:uncharacterized membrane protein